MAEWLRRWTANPLGSARAGSNPVVVARGFSSFGRALALRARGDWFESFNLHQKDSMAEWLRRWT